MLLHFLQTFRIKGYYKDLTVYNHKTFIKLYVIFKFLIKKKFNLNKLNNSTYNLKLSTNLFDDFTSLFCI